MSRVNSRLNYSNQIIPVKLTESIAIPSTGLYRLAELPNNITDYSPMYPNPVIPNFTEVTGADPESSEFRVNYTTGYIKFNTGDEGRLVNITYYGLGSTWIDEDISPLMNILTYGVEDDILIAAVGGDADDSGKKPSTDNTLGGGSSSDNLIPTQKANYDYIKDNVEITDFTNAQHDHLTIQGGGVLPAEAMPATATLITDFGNILDANYEQTTEVGTFYKINLDNNKTIQFDVWETSGNNVNSYYEVVGFGVQNACIMNGGTDGTYRKTTNSFNGTVWSAKSASSVEHQYGGCGTFYAGISIGIDNKISEIWNGSAWSAGGLFAGGGYFYAYVLGTRYNAFAFGEETGATPTPRTYDWNGSAWSLLSDVMYTERYLTGGFGRRNACLIIGGYNGGALDTTEIKNGLAIALCSATLNTARAGFGCAGTLNNGIVYGGDSLDTSEKFNGLTFAVHTTCNQVRYLSHGAGTGNSAIAMNGRNGVPASTNTTEKYTGSIPFTLDSYLLSATDVRQAKDTFFAEAQKTDVQMLANADINTGIDFLDREYILDLGLLDYVDDGIWSTDGGWDLNTARSGFAGNGIMNNSISIGGNGVGVYDIVETFNGSGWSNSTSISVATGDLGSFGKTSATLIFGGYDGVNILDTSYTFDGSAWASSGTLPAIRFYIRGCGNQSAGICCGGVGDYGGPPTILDTTFLFNSAVWSSSVALNEVKERVGIAGKQNSAVCIGGVTGYAGPNYTKKIEFFNGSVWSVVGTFLRASGLDALGVGAVGSAGVSNNALIFGGYNFYDTPDWNLDTHKWNGLYSYIGSDMNTARQDLGGSGFNNSALSFGGYGVGPAVTAVTEKYQSSKSFITNAVFNLQYTMVE